MSSVKMRIAIERAIVRKVIEAALAEGYEVGIDIGDGEEYRGADRAKIEEWAFAGDEARLYLYRPRERKADGWIYAVYGNDGYDVISDYTTNLEKMLKPASELAERCERGDIEIK
jgi:hypothetical protein